MSNNAATRLDGERELGWIFKHVQTPTVELTRLERREGGHEFIAYTVDWIDKNDGDRLYVEIHMTDGDVIWNKQVFEKEEEFWGFSR